MKIDLVGNYALVKRKFCYRASKSCQIKWGIKPCGQIWIWGTIKRADMKMGLSVSVQTKKREYTENH